MRLGYPTNVKVLRVPCTGKVDTTHLLGALEDGLDGVMVVGCMEGECHFLTGNLRARKRVEYVKQLLKHLGINPGRLEMYNLSSAEGTRFAEVCREMTERVRALGPSPVREGTGTEWAPEKEDDNQ
jgi:coenzyme F420-reducing hydrogenase delta subunit